MACTGAQSAIIIEYGESGALATLGLSEEPSIGKGIARAAFAALDTGRGAREELTSGGFLLVEPLLDGSGGAIGALCLRFPPGSDSRSGSVHGVSDICSHVANRLAMRELTRRLASAEQELSRSRARYQELAETVSSGIALVSFTGIIEEINGVAATILGQDPERVIGRDFRDFVAPEDLQQATQVFGARLQGDGSKGQTELSVVRPCGERRLLQVWSSPRFGDAGLSGVHFAARDITDERVRDSQLRRAERLASIAPLLSGVCHELNNPLTSIKSFAELLLLDERDDEDREALEIVKREAVRAARIVTDLRLVARQTQDESAGTLIDANDLVREACRALSAECAAVDAEVRPELDCQLPPLLGVKSQLERVVVHLLSNALQALRERSGPRRISIRTFPCDLGVAIGVEDNGPGIAPEHVDHIFDPFWTTRAAGEGTGLGLSLVHSIVSDHQGRIRVEGGWGHGASVTVEFPVSTEFPTVAPDPPSRSPARTPLRVLVVDDEGPIRFSLARYLQRRGHTVRDAEDGRAALSLLADREEGPFDIIVADLRMPGLGGDQLYHRLREAGDGLEQRLIFITGDAEAPDAVHILDEAGVPVVLKPFELAEIAQIIEAHADVCTV